MIHITTLPTLQRLCVIGDFHVRQIPPSLARRILLSYRELVCSRENTGKAVMLASNA
jgi:hypothetical protein